MRNNLFQFLPNSFFMKSGCSKILIIVLLFIGGCSDRSLFTDPNDPRLGGVFTTIKGEISGTLLKSKSPYYVSENISVPAGADAGNPLPEFNEYEASRNDRVLTVYLVGIGKIIPL